MQNLVHTHKHTQAPTHMRFLTTQNLIYMQLKTGTHTPKKSSCYSVCVCVCVCVCVRVRCLRCSVQTVIY